MRAKGEENKQRNKQTNKERNNSMRTHTDGWPMVHVAHVDKAKAVEKSVDLAGLLHV